MSALITELSSAGILLVLGALLGLADRRNFSPVWLLAAAALVLANGVLLRNGFGYLPQLLPASEWNWQGKFLALLLSLGVASLAAFGWRRSGLTLRHAPGSLLSASIMLGLYLLFFLGIALAFPNEGASPETIAFQLTMPGVEEEIFYRGVLLLALNEAFRGRIRWLGVDWGWGAALSCVMFGLVHAFGYSSDGGFAFDPVYFALTAVPSVLAVWLRERTGSVLMPIVAHNFGNAITLLL